MSKLCTRHCNKIVYAKYDKNLAYKLVFLSAFAHSPDVAKYLIGASEVKTFHLVKQVIKSCSRGAFYSGFVAVSHSFFFITARSLQLVIRLGKTMFDRGQQSCYTYHAGVRFLLYSTS